MIFAYIFLCVCGSIAGATVYMLYQSCTLIVSGTHSSLFSLPLFVAGLIKSFPVFVVLTSLFIPLYAVRHPKSNVVAVFAVYLSLSFLSWGVILPLNALYGSKLRETYFEKTYPLPSAGYFRSDDKYITYYTKVDEEGKANGVQISKDTSLSVNKIESFSHKQIQRASSSNGDFADSIIKKSIEMPLVARLFVQAAEMIEQRALEAAKGGILAWLSLSSIGAALFSVFQLRALSSHKLVNCVIISFSVFAIIALNYLYFTLPIFDKVRDYTFPLTNNLSAYIPEPTLAMINLFIFILFMAIGITHQIFSSSANNSYNPSYNY